MSGAEFVRGRDVPESIKQEHSCKILYINCGSRGAVALDDHVKSAKHIGLVKQRQSSHKLKDLFFQQKEGTGEGVPKDKMLISIVTPKLVPMCDKISNAEVNIIQLLTSMR